MRELGDKLVGYFCVFCLGFITGMLIFENTCMKGIL